MHTWGVIFRPEGRKYGRNAFGNFSYKTKFCGSERKKKVNFAQDRSLWSNALNGHPGYDELLGVKSFDSQFQDTFIAKQIGEGDTRPQAEGRWKGKEQYILDEVANGATRAVGIGNWNRLWGARPLIVGAGFGVGAPAVLAARSAEIS